VRDEPVVAVDQVVGMRFRERLADRKHVVVHALNPRHESIEVTRPARLAHSVHRHPAERSHPRARLGILSDPTRQHIHSHPLAYQRLSELAHVAREPALDHRRVLPGEEQHAIAHAETLSSLTPIGERRLLGALGAAVRAYRPRIASVNACAKPSR
jgi:hypothetical protein